MRQMHEIVETRSIFETRIRQRVAGTAERICAKFTRKTRLVIRSDEFECQGQRSRLPGQKRAVHSQHNIPRRVNGIERPIVADNVTQAAGATIRSLQRDVFAGMRALGLAGYRWALTHF